MLPTQIRNMAVRSMQLIETGRYQPMYYRPYEVNADGAIYKTMADRLARCPNSAAAGVLAGVASQAVMPSATPRGELLIPNSWNERRVRFMLAVDFEYITGLKGTYWIQGYTSYSGVTQSGHVDPDMTFYANSFTTTTQTPIPTPFGIQMNEVIRETVQILSGPSHTDIFSPNNLLYAMRPEDVYHSMQLSQMTYGTNLTTNDISDTRAVVNFMPFVSKREHNIPTDYLGKMISSYVQSRELSEFGGDGRDLITMASAAARDKSLRENMFFQFISSRRTGTNMNQFTIGDLAALDPQVTSKIVYFRISDIMKVSNSTPIPDGGNSEHWNGADLVTQLASMLAESVPAIMLQSLISVASFRSTNHDIGGRHTMVFSNLRSISQVEAQTLASMFQNLFEQRILPDLTMNGMMSYMLDMTCDIAGDTWITLQVDGYPALTFSVPSFCDSLFAPVLTRDLTHFNDTTVKFDQMLNYIGTDVLDNTKTVGMLSTTNAY